MSANQGGSIGSGGGGGVAPPQTGLEMAPYQQIAPLTTQQQQGMDLVSQLTPWASNYLGGAAGQEQFIGGQAPNAIGGQNTLAGNYQQSGAPTAGNIMAGNLMNPSSNQYLTGMYNAAAQPLTQNFEQAVAPGILQNAAQTGTLGSSGQAQAYGQAENALAQGLGNLGANLYGQQYATDLSATTGMLGQGMNQAGNIYGQQLQAAQNAGQMAPQLTSAMYQVPQQLMQSGQLGQQQAQNVLNTASQNLTGQANWPLQALSMLGQGLNTASGGGGTSVQIGTSPATGAGK